MFVGELCLRLSLYVFFFFKQKTAYEMRISDWSSDVCSSDLLDAYAIDTLRRKLRRSRMGEVVERRLERRQDGFVKPRLDRLLAHRPHVGEAHPVGRKHTGEGMDEHRLHAERVGNQAGVQIGRESRRERMWQHV